MTLFWPRAHTSEIGFPRQVLKLVVKFFRQLKVATNVLMSAKVLPGKRFQRLVLLVNRELTDKVNLTLTRMNDKAKSAVSSLHFQLRPYALLLNLTPGSFLPRRRRN
eukprot:SAG25_NODE_296_length_10244_cov_67.215081_7_plen_107_part_00